MMLFKGGRIAVVGTGALLAFASVGALGGYPAASAEESDLGISLNGSGSANVGEMFPVSISALVRYRSSGKPAAKQSVTFNITESAGTKGSPTLIGPKNSEDHWAMGETDDTAGAATVKARAGLQPGTYTVIATTSGSSDSPRITLTVTGSREEFLALLNGRSRTIDRLIGALRPESLAPVKTQVDGAKKALADLLKQDPLSEGYAAKAVEVRQRADDAIKLLDAILHGG
jgi:hypothetical protein